MVKRHAVAEAIKLYTAEGVTDIEILGKPYNIRLKLAGQEVRVDVKGSTNIATEVLVTRNEVKHAREFDRVELVVVDSVEWSRDAVGVLSVGGGRVRRWYLAPRGGAWSSSCASPQPLDCTNAALSCAP